MFVPSAYIGMFLFFLTQEIIFGINFSSFWYGPKLFDEYDIIVGRL